MALKGASVPLVWAQGGVSAHGELVGAFLWGKGGGGRSED